MEWLDYKTLILIFLILLALGYGLFLRRTKKKKITVPLEELSQIWLRYNKDVEPLVPGEGDAVAGLFGEDNKSIEGEAPPVCPGTGGSVEVIPMGVTFSPYSHMHRNEASQDDIPFTAGPLVFFIEQCVKPFREVFETQGAMGLLKAVIEILERYGHCPSVVTGSKDSEAVDLYSVKDNLAQVSLKEHSSSVARIITGILKDTYMDYENHVPKAVITALAHDLGKIPELRDSRVYNTYEHPLISASKLKELADGMQVPWLEDALRAIRDHHVFTSDQFTCILKQADRRAREMELLKFTRTYSITPFQQWFDPEKLIRLIEPHINHMQTRGKWKAFSFKGVVYCQPDFLYEKAKELCRKAKALDLTFIRESERETALRKIVGVLRQAGFIPDMLPPNRCTMKFEIRSAGGKKRFMLTPLRGEYFNLKEIESRKMGYLETIKGVRY